MLAIRPALYLSPNLRKHFIISKIRGLYWSMEDESLRNILNSKDKT